MLDERHRFDPCWQFSITPLERTVFDPAALREDISMSLQRTAVNFLGWQRSKTSSRNTPNLYHLCIDPIVFASYPLAQKGEHETLPQLMTWAQNLREFCTAERINLRPTQGATARQFLRDPRFYPHPRRKVPRATNERIRKNLPGNVYATRLYGEAQHKQATYIDQARAHHYHAANERLPDADTLLAYGNFHGETPREWLTEPERINRFMNGFHGMVLGKLEWRFRSLPWRPPNLDSSEHSIMFFTSELDVLRSLGVKVTQIDTAWGSYDLDRGLNAYATWAIERLGSDPPLWLKTLLLSTYGSLATRARKYTVGYSKCKQSPGVEVREIRAGRSSFQALMRSTAKEAEPSVNNVLHRALIEAATRTESLMFANHLQQHGHRTLAIYADAVIVEKSDQPLPLMLPPWRIKTELHNVRFISSNAFVSDEMSKVPGGLSRRELRDASLAERQAQVRGRGAGYAKRFVVKT
jgi:hypothetical protein